MLAFVVYACLASNPYACTQEVALWTPEARAPRCEVLAQTELTAWTTAHPDQTVQTYWCMHSRVAATQARNTIAACEVKSRPAVWLWARQNPGLSYVDECNRQRSQ